VSFKLLNSTLLTKSGMNIIPWQKTLIFFNFLQNNDRTANRALTFKRTSIYTRTDRQSLVWDMHTDIWNRPHVLQAYEALAVLRFRHLSHHFLTPGDCWHLCQQATALCSKWRAAESSIKGCIKDQKWMRCKGHCSACPPHCTILYCTLIFYDCKQYDGQASLSGGDNTRYYGPYWNKQN